MSEYEERDAALRAAAPQLAAINKTIAHIKTLGRAAAPRTAADLAASLAEDLIAGGELPDPAEIGRRYLAAQEADKHRAAAAQILPEVADHLSGYLPQIRRAAAPKALDHLGKRLQQILGEVRELLPALGNVRDRDRAWSAGPAARDAWAKLEEAAEAYGDVRRAQVDLTREISSSINTTVGFSPEVVQIAKLGLLEMENLDQVANFKPVTDLSANGSVHTPQPWPAVEFGRTYSPAFVLWVARGPAKPWIPTPQQLGKAYDRYYHAYQRGQASAIPQDEHDQLYSETR